jgi:hypothetical protein
MKTTHMIVALGLIASTPLTARAQELNLSSLDEEPNRVHVTTGAEYGFVAGAGYSRVLSVRDRAFVVTGDLTLPWAGLDLSDYRVRVGALLPIVGSTRWKLAGSIAPIARGTKNSISRMTDVGVDVGLVGGYYTRRWFAAGELGVDLAVTTNIEHTDEYRMSVHADAKDGWYANTGGNLRAGLQAGVAFSAYDVILRAGQVRDVGGEPPMLPFYGTLTVATRW